MKENEIQKLIDIRRFLILNYNNLLDKQGNKDTSVILQKDVAYMIEKTIKNLDQILGTYVKIEKK